MLSNAWLAHAQAAANFPVPRAMRDGQRRSTDLAALTQDVGQPKSCSTMLARTSRGGELPET